MKLFKNFFSTPKNEEVELLKARIAQAEKLLQQISEDPNVEISFKTALDIWDFLHSEEINKGL